MLCFLHKNERNATNTFPKKQSKDLAFNKDHFSSGPYTTELTNFKVVPWMGSHSATLHGGENALVERSALERRLL
jgi:hypothetical protein